MSGNFTIANFVKTYPLFLENLNKIQCVYIYNYYGNHQKMYSM